MGCLPSRRCRRPRCHRARLPSSASASARWTRSWGGERAVAAVAAATVGRRAQQSGTRRSWRPRRRLVGLRNSTRSMPITRRCKRRLLRLREASRRTRHALVPAVQRYGHGRRRSSCKSPHCSRPSKRRARREDREYSQAETTGNGVAGVITHHGVYSDSVVHARHGSVISFVT